MAAVVDRSWKPRQHPFLSSYCVSLIFYPGALPDAVGAGFPLTQGRPEAWGGKQPLEILSANRPFGGTVLRHFLDDTIEFLRFPGS